MTQLPPSSARVPRRPLLSSAILTAALGAGAFAGAPAASAAPTIFDNTAKQASAAAFERVADVAQDKGKVRVIVGLQTTFDPAEATSTARAAGLERRLRGAEAKLLGALAGRGHRVLRTFDYSPYVALELTPAALKALEVSGRAASIQQEQVMKPLLAESTQLTEAAPQTARGWGGAGKTVAVLDSGIRAGHPFLGGKVANEACFDDDALCPNGQTSQTGVGAAAARYDLDFHSTHVSGVAVGKREPGGTFDGVAPDAGLMPVNVLGPNNGASNAELIAGLEWVLARANAGVDVAAVNVSIGTVPVYPECADSAIKPAVDALRARGIPTIFAAGNSGLATGVSYPSCIPTVITVGATNKSDAVWSDSNSSSQVELFAPGVQITSSYFYMGAYSYAPANGTSMAAPHVAGAWAAYLQRYPGSSVDEVLAAMQAGGKPVTDPRNNVTRPRLNVAGAMARWGFVVANQPTVASYTPGAGLEANSTGGSNTVFRTAVGTYSVEFPNLGSSFRGNAQVREYLSDANRCAISSFGGSGRTTHLGVTCTNPAGAAVDTPFVAQFQVNETKRTNQAAYLTSFNGSASNTPFVDLQANSTQSTANSVIRTAVGKYTARFPGLVGAAGNPQVTAAGSTNSCQVVGWTGTDVQVACYNSAGVAADTMFSVAYNTTSTFTGRKGGYIFASDAANTSAYTPSSAFTWNSLGTANTSRRTGTGIYEVRLGALPNTNAIPMVTAYNAAAGVACKPYFWTASGGVATIQVRCTTRTGTLANARFLLSYGTSVA